MRPILLDLDDTLIDDHSSSAIGFEAFVATHRTRLTGRGASLHSEWRSTFAKHWARHERGEVSFLDQRRARVREFLGGDFTDAEADQAYAPFIEAYEASWKLLPGVEEFLERSVDIPKVILTNGNRQQQLRKIAATGLSSHVLAVIAPEDSGCFKPHHEMFLAAARRVGASPSRCIMVGDDPVRDIAPARELGMICVEVKRGHWHDAFARVLASMQP